ncbi:MAG: PepSY-like domain-containing protein [Saprospiraceae bacterium]
MKKIFFFLLLAMISFACESSDTNKEAKHIDDDKIPAVVQQAFEKKYPEEKKPKWEIDRNNNFEAEFKEDGEKYRADFTPAGEWIETEISIKKKDLPKVIRDILKEQFQEYKIVELELVDHAKKGIFYDVEFKKDGKKMDVEFNEQGEVIGMEE